MSENPNLQMVLSVYDLFGNSALEKFAAKINKAVEVAGLKPDSHMISGDKIIVIGRELVQIQTTGQQYLANWLHVWTLRGGDIVDLQEYYSPDSLLPLLGR